MTTTLPSFRDVEAAAERIASHAVRTPLIESPDLNARLGGRILLKLESLQRTGSFKFRGAFNKLSRLPDNKRRRGVVAYSSGNHAQGVAAAAQLLSIPATIVMPSDAPRLKLANTRAFGAEVVLYDRAREDRAEIGRQIAERSGSVLVRPYDDFDVIAGQGTCGLEVAEDCIARDIAPGAVLVCCGGGGLTAGITLAVARMLPDTNVYTVEPEGFDDTARSLASGQRERILPGASTICDALLAEQPGELTFAINRRLVRAGLAVSDEEVRHAIRFAFEVLKIVVEPGGAVALAAVLSGKLAVGNEAIVVIVSGANVDAGTFRDILAEVN